MTHITPYTHRQNEKLLFHSILIYSPWHCWCNISNATTFWMYSANAVFVRELQKTRGPYQHMKWRRGIADIHIEILVRCIWTLCMVYKRYVNTISTSWEQYRFALFKSPPAFMKPFWSSTMESKEWGTQEPLLSITGPVLSGKTSMVISLQVLEYEKIIHWGRRLGLFHGTERNGTERNGTERNGTERNGTERNAGLKHGTHGTKHYQYHVTAHASHVFILWPVCSCICHYYLLWGKAEIHFWSGLSAWLMEEFR